MSKKKRKLVSLREIEGKISPHQAQVERALNLRVEALNFVQNAEALAEFIGGRKETTAHGEDWIVSKDIFPEVTAFFVFRKSDDEFPASLKVLFSGERLDLMSGEDLAGIVIPIVSHMLRYVRLENKDKKLPEVCYRV